MSTLITLGPVVAYPPVQFTAPRTLAEKEDHAVKTGKMSVEMLFNATPEFEKRYAKAWPQQDHDRASIQEIDDEPAERRAASISPRVRFSSQHDIIPAPQDLRSISTSTSGSSSLSDMLKGSPAAMPQIQTKWHQAPPKISIPPVTQSAAAPPPPPARAFGVTDSNGGGGSISAMPAEHAHCRKNGYVAVAIGIFAGGLMAAAMVGAGLFAVPVSRLMMTLVAALGFFSAQAAFETAGFSLERHRIW